MIRERVAELLEIKYHSRILVFDCDRFSRLYEYADLLEDSGFTIYEYSDAISFRIVFEEKIKADPSKVVVICRSDTYVPFDIRRDFFEVKIALDELFPKFSARAIAAYPKDLDIIGFAYGEYYGPNLDSEKTTFAYISDVVFEEAVVRRYIDVKIADTRSLLSTATTYRDWAWIAKCKASIEYYSALVIIESDIDFIDEAFESFVMSGYGGLSSEMSSGAPPILPKALNMITSGTPKVALIVMDGMALFDYEVLSRSWIGIEHYYAASFALIPTVTAISRQSLLSGKFPIELEDSFSLSHESKEFIDAAIRLGYEKNQIEYLRGEDAEVSVTAKFVSIIVNEIDDTVHEQRNGRVGMLRDEEYYAESGKLQSLIRRLVRSGFAVYIMSDHGNTPCTGVGQLRVGIETETKSRRMIVLKDFADISPKIEEYMLEYPGTYLNKDYKYYVCRNGISFDDKGKKVMTHGGISIDEVIVPFIKIKAVE
jgi:hypothetical protein